MGHSTFTKKWTNFAVTPLYAAAVGEPFSFNGTLVRYAFEFIYYFLPAVSKVSRHAEVNI